MQVSLQYAAENLADLASAIDSGEEVEISRPEKPPLKLTISTPVTAQKHSLINSAKRKIWFADDWDSPETNNGIADLFENSKLFPESTSE
jgi:antitoxin (DNA-binding transcriptional repressor) of toxin-antitoxin stability system